jgi:hypothetical protein
MKKHHWLFVCLGALLLILASCVVAGRSAPTLNVPGAGLRTSDGELNLTGTGQPGYEVQALVDGQIAGVTRVGDDGTWSLQISLTEPGEHELRMQTLAVNGVVIGEAEPVIVTLATPEVAPAVVESTPPTLNLPAGAAELETGVLALTGTGEPGSEAQVLVDGQVVSTTKVKDDGTWSREITLTEAGEHELRVQTLDASGTVVAEAEPVSVSLALPVVEVQAPTLNLPAGGAELQAGALTLTGTGEPGSETYVLVDGQIAGMTQVGDDGTWSLKITLAEAGEHELTVRTLDAGGAVVAEAEPVPLSLAPAPEPQAAPASAQAVGPDLAFPADGADVITGQTIIGQLTLIGSAEPGTQVEILDGEDVLGSVETDAEGEWRYTFEPKEGVHHFAARSVADATAISNVIEVRVARPEDGIDCNSNPGIDQVSNYIVGTCDTLSGIGKELGVSLNAVIVANPEIEDPDLIYPGQFVTIP